MEALQQRSTSGRTGTQPHTSCGWCGCRRRRFVASSPHRSFVRSFVRSASNELRTSIFYGLSELLGCFVVVVCCVRSLVAASARFVWPYRRVLCQSTVHHTRTRVRSVRGAECHVLQYCTVTITQSVCVCGCVALRDNERSAWPAVVCSFARRPVRVFSFAFMWSLSVCCSSINARMHDESLATRGWWTVSMVLSCRRCIRRPTLRRLCV